MCVVSMVMDHYGDKWAERWKYIETHDPIVPSKVIPAVPFGEPFPDAQPQITQEELKDLRKLLERARAYDARNNEPDCELDEKKERVKKLAEQLGVAIDFL